MTDEDPDIAIRNGDTEIERLTILTALQNIDQPDHWEFSFTATKTGSDDDTGFLTESPVPTDADWDAAQDEQTGEPDAAVADGGEELVCKHDGCTASFDKQQGLNTHEKQWCDHKPGNDPVTCECGREFDTEHARAIHQGKGACDAQTDDTEADAEQQPVTDGGAESLDEMFPDEYNWKPAPTNFERTLFHLGELDEPFTAEEVEETVPVDPRPLSSAVRAMKQNGWLVEDADGDALGFGPVFKEKYRRLATENDRIKWPKHN